MPLRDGDNHTVAVHKRDGPGEIEVSDAGRLLEVAPGRFGAEEDDRLAILEVVVNLLVATARHFDAVLVDRVVVGASDEQRKPGVATRHLARQSDAFGLATVVLLLLLVLQLQQVPLLLQLRYG